MHQTNQLHAASCLMAGNKPSSQSLLASTQKLSKSLLSGLVAVMTLLAGNGLLATTYYSGSATGDPTSLSAWWDTTSGTGNHPADFTSGDTFVIQSGHNYTIPFNTSWTVNATTAGTAATVQVNSGGTLTFTLSSGSTCKLLLGGNFNKSGTVAGTATSTTGVFEFTSDGAWTGSGDISNVKASIVVDSGVTLDASGMSAGFKLKSSNTIGITVNGTLNIGTLTINGNGNSGATFALGSSATLITATTSASGLPGIFTGFSASKITLPTTANYTFNGTGAQFTGTTANNATMPSTVNNLTINNSAGVTLSQTTEVDGTLALTAGKVTGNAILGSSATISGGSSTAYINGQLTVPFAAPSSASFTFPVGTASAYSPVNLANFTDAGTGTLTASATAAQPPNQSSSGISSTKYIKRYWTLTDNGGFASPSYDFTGTFVAGDIQGGANTASLIVRKWDGSSWSSPAGSVSTSTTATGTGFTTSFGQFAAGELETMPVLDSLTKSAITDTTATLGATVTTDSGSAITDYGIVWSTAPDPTTANNKVQAGTSVTPPNTFTVSATGLPSGVLVYFRGYATSANGTGYSTNGSFLTITNEPTAQASGVSVSARQNGNLAVSWVRGNGAKCLVLVKSGSAVDSDPVDGTTYTASATFGNGTQIGSGNYVAYLGTGTNVTLTGLSAATTYYVAVYELNGAGGSENYLAPPATGSQTTVANPVSALTWNGSVDSDWNNTNNWDLLQVPDVGTPAIIPPSGVTFQPVYSNQLTVASFGSLTSAGTLTINTNGFNSGAVLLNRSTDKTTLGAQLIVNTNGVMGVSGNVALTSNAVVTVTSGGSLTASGQLIIGSSPTGGASSGTVGSYGAVTNNGGSINVGSTAINGTGFALTSSSKNCLLVINGGTNNLGAVTIKRNNTGSFGALGSDGLAIYNGVVTMNGVDVGAGTASHVSMLIAGGIVTNNGSVLINQGSSGRGSRLNQTGGLFVVTNLVNPNPTVSGSLNIYSVTGGTNIVGGISFGIGSAGTVNFTNGAVMYVGSQGMVWDGVVTLNNVLSGGALLGATADWAGSAPMQLDAGIATIQAADMGGIAHNITLSGVLSGAGALTKTGNGTLTLNAAETYFGNTLISAGTLAVGAGGSLNNSGQITVSSGTTFDVTAASGYTVPATKTLGGLGKILGNVTFASTANLSPGITTTRGSLVFSNNVTLTGTATVFALDPNPASPNSDSVTVVGTLDLTGSGNTVDVTGTGPAGSEYPLFKYGTLNGNLSNLTLSSGASAIGYLTNDTSVSPNMIAYVVTKTVHSPTNTVWIGNVANNVWDSLATTNWLIGSTLDYFINGDTAVFNSIGQANSNVVINATLLPASTVADSSGNYIFSGTGSIGGTGGIIKTNTGRLIIQTTNTFTGGVTINQGTVSVASLADDNTPSPLGQTGTLLADGGTLEYTGLSTTWTRPVTMGTNGGAISLPSGVNLTYSGTISGSGPLTKSDVGTLTLTTANTYSGTYLNGGTLVLNNAAGAGSGSITFNGNSTLLIGSLSPANTIALSNNGVISGGNVCSIKNVVGNSNLVIAVTAGTFDLAGNMSAYSGTLTCSNAGGAFVRLNGSTGSKLATWDTGSGTMDLAVRNKSTSPYYFGAIMGGPSSTLTGPTGSDSAGHGAATYQIGDNGLNTTFEGVIKNGSDVSQVLSIVKAGTGTLTLSGASTYTGTTTVSNGTLLVNGNNSSASGAVTVAGGTLGGAGNIGGATTLNAGTILSAGNNSVGTLSFSSSLTLDAASTNNFAVTTSGGVSNSVSVAGVLVPNNSVIQITSGTSLAVGTYPLFTYSGGISGSFDPTPVFDVAPAATASIVDTGSQINLVIGTPAGPSFSSITTSGNDITLNATGGTLGGSVTVLTSTNLTVPLASWTIVTTGNFDGFGNYSYTVTGALTSGEPQQFYVLQTP